MFKNFGIYIPSTGRANRLITLRNIPEALHDYVKLVVPSKEVCSYEAALSNTDTDVEVLGCKEKGIAKTRQWILEECTERYIFMLSDDLYFFHRAKKGDYHLLSNTDKDTVKMFTDAYNVVAKDGYAHGGVCARPQASFKLCSYQECTRVNDFHIFDTVKVLESGVRLDALPLMEDFHATLSLLELGLPNKVLLDYVWNQPGSNTGGGCSTYRSPELQEKCAKKLARLHPKVVKVVKKKVVGVTSWEGMKERTDVQVQWHKAYYGAPRKHWDIERKSLRKTK